MINRKKVNKSAIRKDWIKTKSTFCYKKTAKDDFARIIKNLSADHILISYSTDGIINIEEMLSILAEKGKVGIVMSRYVKFRGGKQSLEGQSHNIEYVLTVDTNGVSTADDIERINRRLLVCKTALAAQKTFNPVRAVSLGFDYLHADRECGQPVSVYTKNYGGLEVSFAAEKTKIISGFENLDESVSLDILRSVYHDLEFMTDMSKEDELYLVLDYISRSYKIGDFDKCLALFEEIPYLLSKFNNKKAFVPSLKAIAAVLRVLNESIEVWIDKELNYNAYFEKFEKILFMKLNYYSKDEQAILLKRQIGEIYDCLIERLTKPSEAIVSAAKETLAAVVE